MKRNRGMWMFAAALLVWMFAAVHAQAAEEGAASSTESAAQVFKWINFAIVAGLVYWVFGKVLPPFFRKNAKTIGSSIGKAASAKAAADAQLREAETKLANLQNEVAELRAVSEREAAAEVERIHAATQSDKQKIEAAAKAEIEAAERAARLELKELAARLAVEGAEALLVKQLTAQAHASLIAHFVGSLEGRPN